MSQPRTDQRKLTPDETIAEQFRAQHGVVADRDVRAAKVTWGRQQRLIANGTWVRFAPGVVAASGSPATWQQRAMAATLSCKAMALLSGASAARLHGFDGFTNVDAIVIIARRGTLNNTAPGVTMRWSRRLSKLDRHVVDGIPVTTQPVTLVHLQAHELNAAKALDSALRRRKPPLWFKQNFERWGGLQYPPTAALMGMLGDRMGKRLPRSWFQRLAKEIFEAEGITLVDEWPVRDDHGTLVAELDLADVELQVAVECQSLEYHSTAADIARSAGCGQPGAVNWMRSAGCGQLV